VRTMFRVAMVAVLLATFSIAAFAQAHEFAITAGGNFPTNDQFNPGNSFAVGAQYDGRIFHVPLMQLYVDVPFVVATKSSFSEPSTIFCPITTPNCSLRNSYRSFFVTPGLKLKFGAPLVPFQPYVVAGVGVAHYNIPNGTIFGNDSSNKAAFEVGGGVDMKIAPFVSLRGEVRDFINGTPDLALITQSGHQHNIVPQVGLVFRF
jgi:Outer membrane protein beta-barrel domain